MKRYAIALASVALAGVAGLATQSFHRDFPAFAPFFFFGAVALSARYGNTRSTLLALAASLGLLDTVFLPAHGPVPFALIIVVRSALFLLIAGYISFLTLSLRASESRYRLLAEALPTYIWTTGNDGVIDYCNRNFLEFCGMTQAEVRSGRTFELIHPDDRQPVLSKALASRNSKAPFQHEYRVRSAIAGEYRWHAVHSQLFVDAEGRQRWLGVATDVTSRRQAEEEMRAALDRLNTILRSITQSFIVLDAEWRFQCASDRVMKLVRRSWDEMKGKVIWDIFPEAAATGFKPGYEVAMRERRPHTFETAYPRPDGSVQHFLVHAFPSGDGVSALIADITDRKKIENELDENRRLLRMVLDAAGVGTWIQDLRTNRIIDLGNTARLLGVERLDRFEDMERAVHPEDARAFLRAMMEARRTGRLESEHRIIAADGSVRRVHCIGSLMREGAGEAERIAGVITDVTDRHRTVEIRSRLAAIVDSSDDAILSKDLNGIITSWNPGAERIFGFTAAEMIGRPIMTIIPQELHEDEQRILDTIARGERIDHFETVRVTKSGARVDVSLSISPIRDDEGKVIGASKIARDITDKLRMQDAMIESEKLGATSRMAAAIAHEINNPLEAVTNLAYLLSTDATISEGGKHLAGLMLGEIGRMSDLTRQSLAFFREAVKPSRFDVREMVDTLIHLNQPLLEQKTIDVTQDAAGSGAVFGSPGEIRQVFANLFRNSIDAVEPGGRIHIRVRATASGATRILIADNGVGISPEIRRRLFQPFVTSKGSAGNGLGLWVSRGIVIKNRGKMLIRTNSSPTRHGTAFLLEFPEHSPVPAPEPVLASRA
jgi:PAS domain S-box-containing protein